MRSSARRIGSKSISHETADRIFIDHAVAAHCIDGSLGALGGCFNRKILGSGEGNRGGSAAVLNGCSIIQKQSGSFVFNLDLSNFHLNNRQLGNRFASNNTFLGELAQFFQAAAADANADGRHACTSDFTDRV
ncbi:hypothetical protein SDC9_120540 [bioreactor metagenome]|uniref:Uncharacterized protein n=1 Tax=bioreactor metagenome TaxID=1076179 RepID=A0A645C7X7_9ZZZZ